MDDRVRKYLYDILAAVREIEEFVRPYSTYESYVAQSVVKRAVERDLEIIGEALHHALALMPEIPISSSRQIIATRHRIIHGYDTVEHAVVWGIIRKHLPVLHAEVEELLRD